MAAGLPLVLLADDDESIRDVIQEILLDEGFEVVAVADGQQALDWLQTHHDPPCIIILDLMMPVMDGIGFLRRRSGDDALAAVPVVVVTAGGCSHVCREHGAEILACIPKPISIERLLAVVQRCASQASVSPA